MHEPNVELLMSKLRDEDLVLDVGGWARPFNRAQWVLDAEPYETRGYYARSGGPPAQGGATERFTATTWVQRDICDRAPWPFADKQFDFAICSHTLEDIRDPLWVCSELIRVARCGYIEVPSREWETCRGGEHPRTAGLSHHRWLIDIEGGGIRFLQKYHLIHSHWRYSFPAAHLRRMPAEKAVQWLWWDDTFGVEEVTIHGLHLQQQALTEYVQRVRPYSRWQLQVAEWSAAGGHLVSRIVNRVRRALL